GAALSRRSAAPRRDPPVALEPRAAASVDHHNAGVGRPRRTRHIDQFRRDRSKTDAVASGDAYTNRIAWDTGKPSPVGRDLAATCISLQKSGFPAECGDLVHVLTCLVRGGKDDPGVVRRERET